MIPNQDVARKLLDGFRGNFPPCVVLYGPSGCGQWEIFQEYYADVFESQDLKVFDKPKLEELLPLKSWVIHQPMGKFRVIVISRLDDISREASNFLLKIIEDSPSFVRWVMISETRYILSPLRSRSFLIPFHPFKPEHGVEERFGGSLQLQERLTKFKLDWIDRRVAELVKTGEYHQVYTLCKMLSDMNEQNDGELEFLRDLYVYCCNLLFEHFKQQPEKLQVIQETKNYLRKNLRGEHTFKSMLLRVLP